MSFLEHDMTPRDFIETSRRPKNVSVQQPPSSHLKTDITSNGRPESTTTKSANGKTLMTDHFSHGGMTLDGFGRGDHPLGLVKQVELPAEGMSLSFGVSQSNERERSMAQDGRATLKKQPNNNDPKHVQERQAKQRELTKETLDQQIAENKQRKAEEAAVVDQSPGYWNEEGPPKSRLLYLSDAKKYNDKSNQATPPNPRIQRPFMERKEVDQDFKAGILKQLQERESQPVAVVEPVTELSDQMSIPKKQVSKKQLSSDEIAAIRKQKDYGEFLKEQMKHVHVETPADRIRLNSAKQKELIVKATDGGRTDSLYEQFTEVDRFIGESSTRPQSRREPRYTEAELDHKLRYKQDLDQQKLERLEDQSKIEQEELEQLQHHREHNPYENNQSKKSGKHKPVRYHQDAPDVELLKAKRYDEYKKTIIEHSEESRNLKQQQRTQEREQDKKLADQEPWAWNRDLLAREQKMASQPKSRPQTGDPELKAYLQSQMEDDRFRREHQKRVSMESQTAHIDNSFVNQLGQGTQGQATTVRSIVKMHRAENDVGIDPNRRSQPVGLNSMHRTQMQVDNGGKRRHQTDAMKNILSHE